MARIKYYNQESGQWEYVNNNIIVDSILSNKGWAADAKAVGDALEGKQPIGDYALKSEIPSVSPGIVDVVKLPTENIKEDSIYRLITANMISNKYVYTDNDGFIGHCVNELPEVGEVVTDFEMSYFIAYYNISDGDVYGYLDDTLAALTSITIPDSVTDIGFSAFYCCSSLTSINIPDSVTSIANGIFYCCSSLTSINMPDGVISIGKEAFRNCTSLTSINYTGTIAQWNTITFGGSNWNYKTPDYTIHCTDGDITKDGIITYHETT